MKSVWGAHVRTPEEDELSEECVCEPARVCLCYYRPPETVERDLPYAYQWLKDTTKDAEAVEDHLPASIHQGASNLHADKDMEDKIKLLDPRVQKLIRTYLEIFEELPPAASCDKLVQMHLKPKPEFVGHKIRRRPYPAPKEQADEITLVLKLTLRHKTDFTDRAAASAASAASARSFRSFRRFYVSFLISLISYLV